MILTTFVILDFFICFNGVTCNDLEEEVSMENIMKLIIQFSLFIY